MVYRVNRPELLRHDDLKSRVVDDAVRGERVRVLEHAGLDPVVIGKHHQILTTHNELFVLFMQQVLKH